MAAHSNGAGVDLPEITREETQRSFGVRGLSIWGGFVNEEYLTALSPWSKQVRVYLEMQDDPVIGTLLDAIKLPLLAADFDAVPFSDSPGDVRARDFLWDAMNGMHRQTFRSFASDASSFTQSDKIDSSDQRTNMHFVDSNASPITSSYLFPGGIFLSHQTDNPCRSNASAMIFALDWSPLA